MMTRQQYRNLSPGNRCYNVAPIRDYDDYLIPAGTEVVVSNVQNPSVCRPCVTFALVRGRVRNPLGEWREFRAAIISTELDAWEIG